KLSNLNFRQLSLPARKNATKIRSHLWKKRHLWKIFHSCGVSARGMDYAGRARSIFRTLWQAAFCERRVVSLPSHSPAGHRTRARARGLRSSAPGRLSTARARTHSARKASIGEIAAARNAGMIAATKAHAPSESTATESASGSQVLTP